jgi:hypothetical protein
VISPLLWLLLSALGLLQPATGRVHTWQGAPPVIITQPSRPTAGKLLTVAVGGLPRRARAVTVEAATVRYPAHHTGVVWKAVFQPPTQGGPIELTVTFTLAGMHYSTAGGVVLVAPQAKGP